MKTKDGYTIRKDHKDITKKGLEYIRDGAVEFWFKDGKSHRIGGPACVLQKQKKQLYYEEGKFIKEEEISDEYKRPGYGKPIKPTPAPKKKKTSKVKLQNKKKAQLKDDGNWVPRVYERTSKGTKAARVLVKCGCCDEQVEIYHDENSLEINGVNASISDWEKILLPLLNIDADFDEEV